MAELPNFLTGQVEIEDVDSKAVATAPTRVAVEYAWRMLERDIDFVDRVMAQVFGIIRSMKIWVTHGHVNLQEFEQASEASDVRRAVFQRILESHREVDYANGEGI